MERVQRGVLGFLFLAYFSDGILINASGAAFTRLNRGKRNTSSLEAHPERHHRNTEAIHQLALERSKIQVHGLPNMTHHLPPRSLLLDLAAKSHLQASTTSTVMVVLTILLLFGCFMILGIFDESGTPFVVGGSKSEKGYSQIRSRSGAKASQGFDARQAARKEMDPPRPPPKESQGGPSLGPGRSDKPETSPFQQLSAKISSSSSEVGGVFNPPNNMSMTFGVPIASGRSTPGGGYPAAIDYLQSASESSTPAVTRPDALCPDLILPVESSYSISFEGVDSGRGPVPIYGRGEKILLTAHVQRAESVTLTMGEPNQSNGSVLGSIKPVNGGLMLFDKKGGIYGEMRPSGGLAYVLSSANVSGNVEVMQLDFDEQTGKAHFVSSHDGSRQASASRTVSESSNQEDRLGIFVVAGVDPVLVILCIVGAMALS